MHQLTLKLQGRSVMAVKFPKLITKVAYASWVNNTIYNVARKLEKNYRVWRLAQIIQFYQNFARRDQQ